MSRRLLNVSSAAGLRLDGVVHQPDDPARVAGVPRFGIHVLNPGLKSRVAPNRTNVRLADGLSRLGLTVLRSDPAGIGDSEGELPPLPVVDLWGRIQSGLFVDDVRRFNDCLAELARAEKLVLVGSCGGAITALLVAAVDPRVSGLVLIDLPVTMASAATERSAYHEILAHDPASRDRMARYYLMAAFRPRSLLRFLSLRSDYRAVGRVLSGKFAQLLRGRPAAPVPRLAGFNDLIPAAFERFLGREEARVCFVCAEKDGDTRLFVDGFARPCLEVESRYRGRYELATIPDANHIYSEPAAQQLLADTVVSWVSRHCALTEEHRAP